MLKPSQRVNRLQFMEMNASGRRFKKVTTDIAPNESHDYFLVYLTPNSVIVVREVTNEPRIVPDFKELWQK